MRKAQTAEKKQEAMELGIRIKTIRKEAGLSLSDVADRLNRDFGANTNKGMLSKYENGIHEPSAAMVYCLSLIFGVSVDFLLGRSDVKYKPDPVQGTEATAYSLCVYSQIEADGSGSLDYDACEMIPTSWLNGGKEYFAYKVSGTRFAPRYYSGDTIIFERKTKCGRDQTALVSVADGKAFLCLINKKREGKIITPLDPTLDAKFYSTEEIATLPVRIHGAAVQVRRAEDK